MNSEAREAIRKADKEREEVEEILAVMLDHAHMKGCKCFGLTNLLFELFDNERPVSTRFFLHALSHIVTQANPGPRQRALAVKALTQCALFSTVRKIESGIDWLSIELLIPVVRDANHGITNESRVAILADNGLDG
jgi:hypothetical protein